MYAIEKSVAAVAAVDLNMTILLPMVILNPPEEVAVTLLLLLAKF